MHHIHLVAAATLVAITLPAQNQAVQLTCGVDGAVEIPYDPAMVPRTGMTVEAWVTFNDSTMPTGGWYWPTIARQNVTPQMESWNFRVSSGNNNSRFLEFILRTPSGLRNARYVFTAGEFLNWTHLAATFDGTAIQIFKNGVQVAITNLTVGSDVIDNGGILRIGNGDPVAPGNEAWNGALDEVRIWPMPRSAAEITQTMNQALASMPGKVLTFNLDGHYIDTSRGLIGVGVGIHTFVAGPTLTPFAAVATNIGASTSLCSGAAGTIDTAMGSLPQPGNNVFTVWCAKGPQPAAASFGMFAIAFLPAPVGQPPLFGVQLAFHPATILTTVPLTPPTTGRGVAQFSTAIPNTPGVLGLSFVCQFGFADALCGPQGYTGSDGLNLTIQQ